MRRSDHPVIYWIARHMADTVGILTIVLTVIGLLSGGRL